MRSVPDLKMKIILNVVVTNHLLEENTACLARGHYKVVYTTDCLLWKIYILHKTVKA